MDTVCLIPAAGKGTRVRPLSHTLPKAMISIAGKPTIYHIIDDVAKAGVKKFVIITGYLRELMESEILSAYPHLEIVFVEQKEMKGLGHACYLAKDVVSANQPLLIVYGDTLFEADLPAMLQKNDTQIGVSAVEDPRRFGVVELDENKEWIVNFIEKPDVPVSNLAIPGVNYFPRSSSLFSALQYIIENDIKGKGEFQITDAFSRMLEQGEKMQSFLLQAWHDAGTIQQIFDTNKILLERDFNEEDIAAFKNSNTIIEPVHIDAKAVVYHSTIGPHVSLAAGCKIFHSTIANSAIDQNTLVENSNLHDSLCGRNSKIKEFAGSLLIGDDCEVSPQQN